MRVDATSSKHTYLARRLYRDQEGGVSTARPIHCTPGGLTRTTTPNRGGSRAQFLLVGTSVRAVPLILKKKNHLPILRRLLTGSHSYLLSYVFTFWGEMMEVIAASVGSVSPSPQRGKEANFLVMTQIAILKLRVVVKKLSHLDDSCD